MSRFLNLDGALKALGELAGKVRGIKFQAFTKARVFHSLKRDYREEEAQKGLSFYKFLQVLDGLRDKEIGRNREDPIQRTYKAVMVAGMHFMDLYNFELERVRRCAVHYSAPDGRIYPFCVRKIQPYNQGLPSLH